MKQLLLLTAVCFLAIGFADASALSTLKDVPPSQNPKGIDVIQAEPYPVLGIKDQIQGWPRHDQYSPPMLTEGRENTLHMCIALIMLVGSLTRLLTSPTVHKFFASIYDPLNW
jgi:hypothetical protein